jgi:hypothetical protein
MPGGLAWSFAAAEGVTAAVAAVLAIAGAILGYCLWKKARISPEEQERLRRAHLVAIGKMGDATLVEVREHHLFYAYTVRGVEYTASQNVSQLLDRIPRDLSEIETVAVRYDPRNPADSIIVAEQWSGLRLASSPRRRTETLL